MNRLNHEQIIHEDAPEPAQIKRLASVGIASAAARRRLKTLQRSKRAHYFVEEVDFLAESTEGSDFPNEIRHRMAGRVGLKLVDGYSKVWSLNYFDTYWFNSENAGWQAARALYRFKWDRSRTLLAERSLRMVGDTVDNDIGSLADQIDSFRVLDDDAALLLARDDFRRVTADECEVLIKESQDYFSVIEEQQVSER